MLLPLQLPAPSDTGPVRFRVTAGTRQTPTASLILAGPLHGDGVLQLFLPAAQHSTQAGQDRTTEKPII